MDGPLPPGRAVPILGVPSSISADWLSNGSPALGRLLRKNGARVTGNQRDDRSPIFSFTHFHLVTLRCQLSCATKYGNSWNASPEILIQRQNSRSSTADPTWILPRSEEHTSELQSLRHL